MQIHMYIYPLCARVCVCGNEDAKKHAEFWRRAVPRNNKRFKQIAKSVCVCVGLGFDSPLALFMPHFALTSASTSPFHYLRFPLAISLSLLLTRLAHSCA